MAEETDNMTFSDKKLENYEENITSNDLTEVEKQIKNKKFFGDCTPCSGYSYPVTFIQYDSVTAAYTGNLLDFNHTITLRAIDAKTTRKFNPQVIKTDGKKVYKVRCDDELFVSCKNVDFQPRLFEEIKKIKRKLINFYRNKKEEVPETTIIEFWDKYIDPLAVQYNEELRKTVTNDETEIIEDFEISSIIEYLEDKYSDKIYNEYLTFLNTVEVVNKLTKEFVEFKSLNLDDIKDKINKSLSGLDELDVTFCKDKVCNKDVDFSIRFKVEGKSSYIDTFKESLNKIDDSVQFSIVN